MVWFCVPMTFLLFSAPGQGAGGANPGGGRSAATQGAAHSAPRPAARPLGTAQPPARAVDAAAVDRDAQQALQIAEELRVLETLRPLKLSASQIDELIPVVDGAQARLKQLETERKLALADRRASLVAAWDQAIHGGKPASRVQQQLLLLRDTSERKEKQARMDLVISVSAKFDRLLSTEQAKQVKALTQTSLVGQPSPFSVAGQAVDPDAAAGSDPSASSDLSDKMSRELDKLRKAKPGPQYEIRRVKFIDQFVKGMDPDAPGYQKQLDSLFSQAGDIHDMSSDTFEQQRKSLLDKYVQLRHAALVRVQANRSAKDAEAAPLQNSTGLELFVEKVLMSPRAALVLREMRKSLS
jgi:hypothetical protein